MRVFRGQEAALVHRAIVEQDKRDSVLLTDQRRRLRNALKYGLRRRTSAAVTDRRGRLKDWFITKLDSLVAYGLADMTKLSERQIKIARAYFFEGAGTQQLGQAFAISQRQVQKDVASVLNTVIETAPASLIRILDFSVSQYILHGCAHCGDTMEWDRDGAHDDGEGEYVCLHCGRRYTFDLKLIS